MRLALLGKRVQDARALVGEASSSVGTPILEAWRGLEGELVGELRRRFLWYSKTVSPLCSRLVVYSESFRTGVCAIKSGRVLQQEVSIKISQQ